MRQAVSAHANMTYKLLVNGFVSMTGGQPVDGELSVPQLITASLNEGATKVVVVTEDVERVKAQHIPAGIEVHHRRELEAVQRDLREMEGVTVLIYDQACATERRRLRKRGKWDDPKVRTYIHPEICEAVVIVARSPAVFPLSRWKRLWAANVRSISPPATRTFPALRLLPKLCDHSWGRTAQGHYACRAADRKRG